MAQNPIPYKIIQIEIEKFEMNIKDLPESSQFEVRSSYSFQTSFDIKCIRCISSYSFFYDSEMLITLRLICVFAVEQNAFEGMFDDNHEKFVIDKYFCQYMATIAVGAARGVIAAKTEGTPLAKLVLPPINLVETIKNDSIFIMNTNN